ncbi:MAG TPA: lipocalin family protein [Bordetella sp.]|nr:lipocalin family protein [Bordetella sp.]
MRFAMCFPVVAALALSACAGAGRGEDMPTQSGVDLSRYAGTWYELARLPNSFQDECAGEVKAIYTLEAGNKLGVTNQCRERDGAIESVQGQGRLNDDFNDKARLQVRFAPAWTSWLPWVWGDYWILRIEGNYQYSLVGTPDREYLWVLARSPYADPAIVQRLLDYARRQGFDTAKVLPTRQ